MNYDDPSLPFPVAEYRAVQKVVPGIEALYLTARAILEAELPNEATLLLVGAGGGREIEALGSSPKRFSLVAVDPSAAMLDMARLSAQGIGALERTRFVQGEIEAAPTEPCGAATSLLVMHFLPDDGRKLDYLRAIRSRLLPGSPFLLADISFDEEAEFERLAPAFLQHARLVGLPDDKAALAPPTIKSLPIIGECRTRDLLRQAGFGDMTPFFRGLWYAGWWAKAV